MHRDAPLIVSPLPARCPPDGTPCWLSRSPINRSGGESSVAVTGRIGPVISAIRCDPSAIFVPRKRALSQFHPHYRDNPKKVLVPPNQHNFYNFNLTWVRSCQMSNKTTYTSNEKGSPDIRCKSDAWKLYLTPNCLVCFGTRTACSNL